MSFLLPHGSASDGPFALEITPERAGWAFSGLRVLALAAGAAHAFDSGDDELIVLPLEGGCTVRVDDVDFTLVGRDGVFAQVTDFVYVPRDARVEIASERGGRFALPSARAAARLEPRRVAADDVPVELRGAGQASRQVNNFCSPEAFAADRLIAVEVLTPAGNWSSYPPHKHDEEMPGEEVAARGDLLLRGGRRPAGDGFGYQRVYGSGPGREIDVLRRGPQRRRAGHAARLPRAVDGGAGLRPLLPQRDGRARASASGASATTPPTPGSASPGRTRRSIPDCR